MKKLKLINSDRLLCASLTQEGETFLLNMKIYKYAFGQPRHVNSTDATMLSGTDS